MLLFVCPRVGPFVWVLLSGAPLVLDFIDSSLKKSLLECICAKWQELSETLIERKKEKMCGKLVLSLSPNLAKYRLTALPCVVAYLLTYELRD